VNNRNLRTLQVDIDGSYRLAGRIPREAVGVSESGLSSRTDLERLAAAGYRAFLIGERFMTDPDPAAAIQKLLGGLESCVEDAVANAAPVKGSVLNK
jgi:indole-3-glycerol phosphate synthase